MGSAGQGATPGRRLLPPERWFALFILERQRTHRTPAILRLEQNYGPEGIALLATTILWGLTGSVIGCIGIVFLFVSWGPGPLLHTGYYLIFAGILLECPAMIRAIQGIYVGRRFRGDRPFAKRL
jgi:hypothetical protein